MHTVSEQFKLLKGTFDVDLGTQHHFSSGVYAKQMMLPKGYFALSHAHAYDHLSILASGEVFIKTDNKEEYYKAPACITIKKGVHHSITALQDAVWFCIHATDETSTNKIDEVLIMKEGV
jgi:mannose-6-phosphate isomerase-like protein (cupin superfamily)